MAGMGLAGAGWDDDANLFDVLVQAGKLGGGMSGKMNKLPIHGIFTSADVYQGPDGRVIHRAPPGYVVVPDTNIACWRPVAIQLRIWKPAKKPLISRKDETALRRSAAAQRRYKALGKRLGITTTTRRRLPAKAATTRRRTTRRKAA